MAVWRSKKGFDTVAKYVYPAIFTPEEGGYSIRFPDIENCFTGATTLEEAMEMANDVLYLMLYELEQEGAMIPAPSAVQTAQQQTVGGEFVTLVSCDTIAYRRFYDNKAVKKTLSIPSWLNDMAERAGVNFSGVLQEALKQRLNIL